MMAVRSLAMTTVTCLCLTVALGGCDMFSPEAKKAKHREHATNYFEKGQYQEALIEYKNVSQLEPKDADAHYRMALAYMKLGGMTNLQSAFSEFAKTVELDKENTDAQLKLGELYLLGNRPDKAREHAEIVLASAPQNTDGLALKGRSLLTEQRFQEGIDELKKALQLSPKNMRLYIDLARAYMLKKEAAATEAILKDALTVEPRSIEVLLALGDYRTMMGQREQAEALYKQALEIDLKNEASYLKLASFYQLIGKWAEADSVYQKLASVKPQDEQPQLLLGDFYAWLGQQDKALASYQRATEINAKSIIARDKLIAHYLDAGNVSEAEGRVKTILDASKKDLSGRFFEARLRLAKRETDEAVTLLQGVIKDEPQFAAAHYFLGLAFLQKQQVAQARGEIGEAVKIAPGLIDAHIALAGLHLAEGAWDLAIEQAQTALKLNPRKVQAAITLGDALFRKGEKQKSKQVFAEVDRLLPAEPIGPYKLALIARAEKNEAQALAHLEEALKRKPAAIEPLAEIAGIKISQGKLSEARERVTRQLEAVPNSAHMYNLLGQLWLGAKDWGQAETAFKKAIAQDSSLLVSYVNLGSLYQSTGRLDEAAKEYEAALAKAPSYLQANMLLGTIYERKKEYDKAAIRYKEALKLNPKFSPAANNLAWILAEQGTDLDGALSYAQTAREHQPDDPSIADTLGWIYYKKNAFLLAVELLKEANEKLSNNPVVKFHYGMALYKKGDFALAKKILESSLKLSPNYEGSTEARRVVSEL